jgi:hypothetical protein
MSSPAPARWLLASILGVAAVAAATGSAGTARADEVAYLVNVHMRPGYGFPDAETALAYGNGICEKVTAAVPFAQLMAEVRTDFDTTDEYQALYLISQATNELCPAQIWRLRESAAGYRSPTPAS